MPRQHREGTCIADGDYRWLMEVQLRRENETKPCLVVILKNPSTADVHRSDPTVGKVEAWARRQHFVRIVFLNLFARRGAHPEQLTNISYDDLVGKECDRYIREGLRKANGRDDMIVLACGDPPEGWNVDGFRRRLQEVRVLIGNHRVFVVGDLTQRGYPRHGLMWNGSPSAHPYTWNDEDEKTANSSGDPRFV